jgi:hypothetical protein
LDHEATIKNVWAEMGVHFETSDTFIEVSTSEIHEHGVTLHLDQAMFIVDTIAVTETWLKYLKNKGDDRSLERMQSMCGFACWTQRAWCLSWSVVKNATCHEFCLNHPVPPPNCFDTCALERHFRDLECEIDYLICLDNCGGGC